MTAAIIEQVRAVVTTAGPDGASTFVSAGELTAVAAGRGTRVGQWPVWGTADGTAVVGEPLPAVHQTSPSAEVRPFRAGRSAYGVSP
jgi:hypothetical protein